METTKERCESEIKKLHHVCDYCGRELQALKTVDNSGNDTYWIGCTHGDGESGHFTSGVPKEIYEWAVQIVCDDILQHHPYSDYSDIGAEYWFESEVHIWSRMLQRILAAKNKGISKHDFIEKLIKGGK